MGALDGRTAIITGAGRGLGREHALLFAQEGAKVVVNDLGGDIHGEGADRAPAQQVVDEIEKMGGEAVANVDSAADWNGAQRMIQTAIDTFGDLHVLVNNAGILRDRVIVSMTEEDFDAVVRVHLKGTFAMTHHAANHWRERSKAGEQPRAAIVNTVSSAGLQGNVGQANYGSAKAGIAALTVISSLELSRYGVRANAIAPGGFTRMVGQAMKDIEVKEPEEYDEFVPLNPGNSAPMVAWLASDQAMHVTGQVFRAVGHTIARYVPWTLGATVETPKEPARWDAAAIGPAVNAGIFGSRAAGLVMGGG
jgi:NAD(P)-dependent dehydrogenase (short-subunit alcohol dehydrogenase family)